MKKIRMTLLLTGKVFSIGCASGRALLPPRLRLLTILFGLLTASIASAADMVLVSNTPLPATKSALTVQAFSALPDKIFKPGDIVGLSWSVPGATSVTLTDTTSGTQLEGLLAQGVVRVTPQTTTTYTLSATGPAGTITAKTQITLASAQPQSKWQASANGEPNLTALQRMQQQPESIGASLTALRDGTLYQGSFDGNYYQFSEKGTLNWTLKAAGVVMNQAAVAAERIYVGTSSAKGGRLLALKPDKSILWDVQTDSGVIASPTLNASNNTVYAASYNGTLLGLNAATGSEQWRYQLPEGETITAAPTLSADESTLYIHSTDHKVYAVSTEPAPPPGSTTTYQVIHNADGPVVVVPFSHSAPQQSTLRWQRDLQTEPTKLVEEM
ncbi:hypothetical protein AB833_04015 [Chromatiales bacterium (ex Bugula neritina AB1)]|nr:hypothetical protein AB833_04015 [Chromatiales bacterium (ex Bugula neritina AB1)]